MKTQSQVNSFLRNDRGIWLTVAAILSGCALASSASAATITENATAPGAYVVAENLDTTSGTHDTGRDYNNNNGPAGQTFEVSGATTLGAISIKGNGDSAGGYSGGPLPFNGTEVWSIMIGTVNTGSGAITALDTETATGFTAGSGIADYLTFTLATPVSLSAGVEYAYTVGINEAGGANNIWFGEGHGTADATATSYGFNDNSTDANASGNSGGNSFGGVIPTSGFAGAIPAAYSFNFVAQAVPEPTTLALAGLGGLGWIAAKRRRRA